MLNVIMLNVIMLNVIMLNVIMLSVIMLSVAAPNVDSGFLCNSVASIFNFKVKIVDKKGSEFQSR